MSLGRNAWIAGLLASAAMASRAYAAPPDLQTPPPLVGVTAALNATVSGNGQTVAGSSTISGAGNIYLWTIGDAASTGLGRPGGFTSNGLAGISYDGSVLVSSSSSSLTPAHALRWTLATGWVDLGTPAAIGGLTFGGVTPVGMSYDGATIVGQTSLNTTRPFIWREGAGFQVLDVLPTGFTGGGAQKVSGDGTTVVGLLFGAATANQRGFVWKNGVFTVIPVLNIAGLTRSSARAVNADGTVVAGDSQDNSGAGAQIAYRWTAGTGPVSLGTLSNTDWSLSSAISGDGGRIVGQTGNTAGSLTYGFLWTPTDGMRSIDAVMAGIGVGSGWHMTSATSISADGNVITGSGRNPANQSNAYVLRLAQNLVQTTSTSTSTTVTVVPVSTTNTVLTNRTIANGRLNGVAVFTGQADQIASGAASQSLFASARSAVQATAGLRRVTFTVPTLISSSNILVSSGGATVDSILDGAPQLIGSFTTSGPATILIGDLGVCTFGGAATAGGNPAQGPSGCASGTATTLAANQENTNTHYNISRTISRTTTTTEVRRLEEAYAVDGTAGYQIGGIHQVVRPASFDAAEHFLDALTGRRADVTAFGAPDANGDQRGEVWIDGYYAQAHLDGDGAVAARSAIDESGVTGAVGYRVRPGLTLGAAIGYGQANLDVAAAGFPEQGDVRLTQAGLYLDARSGGLLISAAAGQGSGEVRSLTGSTVDVYDLHLQTVGLRIRYPLALGSLRLTPEAGASLARVKNAALSETGPLALTATAQAADRRRIWLGTTVSGDVRIGPATIEPSLSATVSTLDDDGLLRAAFASAPGTTYALSQGPLGRIETGLSAGVAARLSHRGQVRLSYEGRFRDGAQSNGLFLTANLSW